MIDQDNFNQTLFSEQQPAIERASAAGLKTSREVKKPSPFMLLIVVGLIVMVAFFALRTLRHTGKPQTASVIPSPSVMATALPNDDEIEALYDELEDHLKKADPTANILPFPPIARSLMIDQ